MHKKIPIQAHIIPQTRPIEQGPPVHPTIYPFGVTIGLIHKKLLPFTKHFIDRTHEAETPAAPAQ